ncbi:MAG: cache domain-containing protein [Rhodoferax sp.]|nr:cache domain-containing protein [Rhodoferax sp.]
MALLPLLVVLPLLVGALVIWGNAAYDRLLITKVRSDLAVARGYFQQVLYTVGAGTQAVAASHTLHVALARQDLKGLQQQLMDARARLDFDFINLYNPQGTLLTANWIAPPERHFPAPLQAEGDSTLASQSPASQANLALMSGTELLTLAPHLAERLNIPLIATRGASPTERSTEDRALVMLSTTPVLGANGETLALLRGGVLLNQNLDLIDHINRIVYPEGSLPFDSHGTATLFMEDVRITTNVRLFQDQRAIGTRVSQAVRQAVLEQGGTWLDRAFVVNDWYVSAYEPLIDSAGQRVGMLYVGFLEKPFRFVKYGMLALIAGIFVLVMVLAALFSVRWARSIFKPVEQMNHAMQRVQDGDPGARVGPVEARDEIGTLANHLDQLLNVIDDKTQALQRWAGELDAKVIARTQELAQSNTSLQAAQQQLIKSEKLATIGQLTASVAHEINNPIAVIQGNLDLVRELLGPHAQPVAAELKLMDQQVDRMRLIVTQLLQHARPTDYAGYVELVDVNKTLENALLLVGHLLAHTRIDIRRELQASARVGVNAQELQQVVINLLINAIQAMPEGGTLTLSTRNWLNDDTNPQPQGACIEVQDSGSGLNEAALEKVFTPFFSTKNDGNGLGLWISQGLVERYGGRITAVNIASGHGACFTVCLLTEARVPGETPADASPK